MNFGSKGTTYVAVGLTALGFFVIFWAWNRSAELDYVSGQMPYLISGAFTGLGLIMCGLTLAIVEARRRDSARLVQKLDQLIEASGGTPERPLEVLVADSHGDVGHDTDSHGGDTVAGRRVRRRQSRTSA